MLNIQPLPVHLNNNQAYLQQADALEQSARDHCCLPDLRKNTGEKKKKTLASNGGWVS